MTNEISEDLKKTLTTLLGAIDKIEADRSQHFSGEYFYHLYAYGLGLKREKLKLESEFFSDILEGQEAGYIETTSVGLGDVRFNMGYRINPEKIPEIERLLSEDS